MRAMLAILFGALLGSCGSSSPPPASVVQGPESFSGSSWFKSGTGDESNTRETWLTVDIADSDLCVSTWPQVFRDAELRIRDPSGAAIKAGTYPVAAEGFPHFLLTSMQPVDGGTLAREWSAVDGEIEIDAISSAQVRGSFHGDVVDIDDPDAGATAASGTFEASFCSGLP